MKAATDRGPLPLIYTAAAIAVTVAFIGFVSGTRDPGEPRAMAASTSAGASELAVPTYDELEAQARGPNGHLNDRTVVEGLPAVTDAVDRNGDIAEVRAARAARRAYAGAPPTIPHAVDQMDKPACLACHERGAKIGERIAPAMSHQHYDSCNQCHVPQHSPLAGAAGPMLTENSFRGLLAPTTGTRAWAGAPPTMPHGTWMRERCASCHGVAGASPMKTSHPWRQSCTQCHVSDAGSSQVQPRLKAALREWGDGPPPVRRR